MNSSIQFAIAASLTLLGAVTSLAMVALAAPFWIQAICAMPFLLALAVATMCD